MHSLCVRLIAAILIPSLLINPVIAQAFCAPPANDLNHSISLSPTIIFSEEAVTNALANVVDNWDYKAKNSTFRGVAAMAPHVHSRRWFIRLAASLPVFGLWGQDQRDPLEVQLLAEINRVRREGKGGSAPLGVLLAQAGAMSALARLFSAHTADSTHIEITRYLAEAASAGADLPELLEDSALPTLVASRLDDRTAGYTRTLLEESLKKHPERQEFVLEAFFEAKQLAELRRDEGDQRKIAAVLNELGTAEDFFNLPMIEKSLETVLRQVETNGRFEALHLRQGVPELLIHKLLWPALRPSILQALEALHFDNFKSPNPDDNDEPPSYAALFFLTARLYDQALVVGDQKLANALERWSLRLFQQPGALAAFRSSMSVDDRSFVAGLELLKKSGVHIEVSDPEFVGWLVTCVEVVSEAAPIAKDILAGASLTDQQKQILADADRYVETTTAHHQERIAQIRQALSEQLKNNPGLDDDELARAFGQSVRLEGNSYPELYDFIAAEKDPLLLKAAWNLVNRYFSRGHYKYDAAWYQAVSSAIESPDLQDIAWKELEQLMRDNDHLVLARALLLKAIGLHLLIDLPQQSILVMDLMQKLSATKDPHLQDSLYSQLPTNSQGQGPYIFMSEEKDVHFLLQLLAYDLSPEQRAGIAHALFHVTSFAYSMIGFPEGFFAAVEAISRFGDPADLNVHHLTLFLPPYVQAALLGLLSDQGLPIPEDLSQADKFLFLIEQAYPSLRTLTALAGLANPTLEVSHPSNTLQCLLRIASASGTDTDTAARRSKASQTLSRLVWYDVKAVTFVEILLTELLLARANKNKPGETALTQILTARPTLRVELQEIVDHSLDAALREEAQNWLSRAPGVARVRVPPRPVLASA